MKQKKMIIAALAAMMMAVTPAFAQEENGFKKFKQEAVTDELIFVYMEK